MSFLKVQLACTFAPLILGSVDGQCIPFSDKSKDLIPNGEVGYAQFFSEVETLDTVFIVLQLVEQPQPQQCHHQCFAQRFLFFDVQRV